MLNLIIYVVYFIVSIWLGVVVSKKFYGQYEGAVQKLNELKRRNERRTPMGELFRRHNETELIRRAESAKRDAGFVPFALVIVPLIIALTGQHSLTVIIGFTIFYGLLLVLIKRNPEY